MVADMNPSLAKIEFYVPPSHLEAVKAAMFAAGAGKVGEYDCCAWQTQGRGQYRGSRHARPFAGEPGRIETIEEYKVEMVCEASRVAQVIEALKRAHPYEEPAYSVLALLDPAQFPSG